MESKEKTENKILFNAEINEIFAKTELIQEFQNPYEDSIELEIIFPINRDINLSKFEISMNEKKIVSRIMEKEKAEEKYTDTIAKGNTGFLGQYSNDMKSYCVNIGNLNSKEKITLKTIYNQSISSYDMSYEYIIMNNFPSFIFNSKDKEETKENKIEIIYNIDITACSKITRLFTNFKNKENINITYNEDYTKSKISHRMEQDLSNKIIYENKINDDELHILFRTKDINKPTLFYQYNPFLKKHSYSLNYLYSSDKITELIDIPEKPIENDVESFYEKYLSNIASEEPALFIFLVDQSGSMSGNAINVVIESLLIFIQSLPKDSYFQIIGFGSDFEKYNETPVKYDNKNIKEIIKKIKELKADKGGTDIVRPLNDIFKNKMEYEKIKLSKNIILLTDGEVDDKNACFNLIKENSDIFKVHSIGIGNDFDGELIKLCGIYGKGSFNFVKNLENINNVVIKILKKCIMPYLYDIKFNFLNIEEDKENDIILSKNKDFAYQDEIINYSFILDENNKHNLIDLKNNIIKFKIEYIKKKEKNEIIVDFNKNNIICLPDGDNMTKIIVDKYLKTNLNMDEKSEIKISKEYEVLSKNTSFFAEIENENSQQNKLIKINILSNINRYISNINLYHCDNFFSNNLSLLDPDLNLFCQGSADFQDLNLNCFAEDCCACENVIDYSEKKGIDCIKIKKTRMMGKKISKNHEKIEKKKKKSNNNKKENKENEDIIHEDINLVDLILNQNPIDGFWDKDKSTLEIEKLLDKHIIDNIKKLSKNKKEKDKAYYTILIIYFITTKYPEKLGEYELVLNKAKNYLKGINIIYDKIISKINK
jgi:uncharacterized protein YegL